MIKTFDNWLDGVFWLEVNMDRLILDGKNPRAEISYINGRWRFGIIMENQLELELDGSKQKAE